MRNKISMKSFWKKINLRGVKHIFLDLDNTLYRYDVCHEHALLGCYNIFHKKHSEFSFADFEDLYKRSQNKVKKYLHRQGAGHSRLLYFQKMFEELYGKTSIVETIRYENFYWRNFFKKMKLSPGVKNFLVRCKKNHIAVCLLTDLTTDIQFKKILFLGLDKYIDWVVTSEEASGEKPFLNIFELAIEKTGADVNSTVMIGDSEEKDIMGARKFGIKKAYKIKHNYAT